MVNPGSNSPELTRGSSLARPETVEGFGFLAPATKWPAETTYVTLAIPRVEWCSQLRRGRPISTAASSKAAAGVRVSVETALRGTSEQSKTLRSLLGSPGAR